MPTLGGDADSIDADGSAVPVMPVISITPTSVKEDMQKFKNNPVSQMYKEAEREDSKTKHGNGAVTNGNGKSNGNGSPKSGKSSPNASKSKSEKSVDSSSASRSLVGEGLTRLEDLTEADIMDGDVDKEEL